MSPFTKIGLIDNLSNPHELVLHEGYEAPTERYMAALGGNNGNLAFVHGAHRMIAPRMTRIGFGWTPERVREVADVIVISCANQIGAHADLGPWADALERFGLPVVLLGLGAQTTRYEGELDVPAGTRRLLDLTKQLRASNSPNIAVRGEFTQKVLANLGADSLPLGCPSLFISSDVHLGRSIAARSAATKEIRRIAIAAGNTYHPGNLLIERRMVELCTRLDGAYIVQHPNVMVALAINGAKDIPADKVAQVATDLGFDTLGDAQEWFRRNAWSFHDAETWMHALRHQDAVTGARYHGIAFGVQAGVPGVVLHIDNRTRELATTTGIPTISVEDVATMNDYQLLGSLLWSESTGAAFDTNRHTRAAAMSDFLTANGIQPSARLLAIADAGRERSADASSPLPRVEG